MASKRLIPVCLMFALLAILPVWRPLTAQGPATAQEPAGATRPFYQQVFGLGSQNQVLPKGSDKAAPSDPVEPAAGIPLKKPAAIPLPKRSFSPAAATSNDSISTKGNPRSSTPPAAADQASVQKAIELINRTYRAEEGASRVDDQPTDLERQMLAPFLPGATQTKGRENGSRPAREIAGAPYTQGTIQFEDRENEPAAAPENPKRPLTGSWFGQGKAAKTVAAKESPTNGSIDGDPRNQGNGARSGEPGVLRMENKRPAATRIAQTSQTDRQATTGAVTAPAPTPTAMSSQNKVANLPNSPNGKSTPRRNTGAKAGQTDLTREENASRLSGFFFLPSRWFGPGRKQEASDQVVRGSRKGEFASEPVQRTATGTGLTQVAYESAAGVTRIPTTVPGAGSGEWVSPAQQSVPAPGRSQFNEAFPGQAQSQNQSEGPELPQPFPSASRQPLPRGPAESAEKKNLPSSGAGNSSGRSVRPSLSGRGELLPFPDAGQLGAGNLGAGNFESQRAVGSQPSGSGYQGIHDGMRVPPGGFAESEMATEPDGSLELPAPRLANAPEAKIRGLIQALADERQKAASAKKENSSLPALKDAGLDENQRLKWRIELAMDKVMAERNRAPGYDATRDGNATGPVGIDLWERARSYYDRGEFVAAMETLRALEKTETRGELILPARFLLASCLVQSGRGDDASKILRELAAAQNDRVIADLAQWRLSQIRSRMQLEKTLEEVRAKSLRLAEIQN